MTSGIDDSTQAPPVAAAPPAPPKGPVQRIIGTLFSPEESFRDIVQKPDILVPLIVILLIGLLSAAVIVPKIDFESAIREQLEQNKNISAEDMNRMLPMMVASGKIFTYASPLFGLAFLAAMAGILLLAFRVFGAEGNYKQAFSVTLYSWMPQVISTIVATVIVLMRQGITAEQMRNLVKSNLGALVDPKQQMVAFAALSSLDIFTIWTVILLIIGFAHVARVSKGRAAATVIPLWLVVVAVKVALAAFGASRMKQT